MKLRKIEKGYYDGEYKGHTIRVFKHAKSWSFRIDENRVVEGCMTRDFALSLAQDAVDRLIKN